MELNTHEENQKRAKILAEAGRLPDKDEIIICDGVLLVDAEGPLKAEDVGEKIGCSILCG
jgi:hypothetical protein